MQWLAQTSVARPVFATVLILSMTVLGLYAIPQLGVERYPNIDIPYVTVMTTVPGASPQEIEADVTDVIERQVNTVPGLESITSTSFEGMSLVVLLFEIEKNGDVAAQEVRAKVDLALPELPREAERPGGGQVPHRRHPRARLRPHLPRRRHPRADRVREAHPAPPVAGNPRRGRRGAGGPAGSGRSRCWPTRLRMKSFGLTVVDLQRMLAAQNAQIPSGSLERGTAPPLGAHAGTRPFRGRPRGTWWCRARGGVRSACATWPGWWTARRMADTRANVSDTPAVLLNVRKQSGENTVAVVQAVRERLRNRPPHPARGLQASKWCGTSPSSSWSPCGTWSIHLVLGSILAALVVLVFLKDWRSTIIAAIAIPTPRSSPPSP